jgi:hypothetical protein
LISLRITALSTALAVTLFYAPAAFAQPTPEQLQMVYNASRNQQGMFEYCQTAGFVTPDVLAIQQRIMAMLPVPDDTSGGDAAYISGKAGTLVAGDQTVTLADAAKGQNLTEKVLCERMGDAMKNAAASLPPG